MIIYCSTDQQIEVPFDTLKGVTLENLNLHRAELENKDLSGSSFIGSNLRGAFLFSSDLNHADLRSVNLIVADFRKTNLREADLRNCLAISTLFENSNLQNANLEGANIEGANFISANLKGANLNCVGIEKAKFANAIFDNETIWPDNFDPNRSRVHQKIIFPKFINDITSVINDFTDGNCISSKPIRSSRPSLSNEYENISSQQAVQSIRQIIP